MSYGAQVNTRITHLMHLSISWRESWLLSPLGHESTESSGECADPSILQWLINSDIPMPLVSSGVENGNLRELALARMKDFGAECRDVRYREVGVSNRPLTASSSLIDSYTRSTIESDPNPLSSSDGITQQMADGRLSYHTKIPRQTFLLAYYD